MFVTLWRQYKSILKVRGHHRGPLQNMKVKISLFKRHVYMLHDWSVVDFSGASVSSTQSRPKQTDNKRMTVEYVNTVFHRGATFSLEAAGPAGQRIMFSSFGSGSQEEEVAMEVVDSMHTALCPVYLQSLCSHNIILVESVSTLSV